jgi:hypothetical protein
MCLLRGGAINMVVVLWVGKCNCGTWKVKFSIIFGFGQGDMSEAWSSMVHHFLQITFNLLIKI